MGTGKGALAFHEEEEIRIALFSQWTPAIAMLHI